MGVKKFYSKREKKYWKYDAKLKQYWSHGFDITLASGKRLREAGFMSEADAIVAIGKIRSAEKDKKYGFIPDAAKPRLASLVEQRLKDIKKHSENVRSKRVLETLLTLLGTTKKIEDVTTPDLKIFIERRELDGQSPSSIDRELNIISAMLNAASEYFPQLSQWRPPKIPRSKISKKRRERNIPDEEKYKLLDYLQAPRKEGEQQQAADARRRVGLKFEFGLSIGLRHGEMVKIRKVDVNFGARSLKIVGTKTEFDNNPTRYVQPLTVRELEILREFYDQSETEFVFSRGGNITPKFYRIFSEACAACGIPYGRGVEDGLVFHDARHHVTTRMLEEGASPATVQAQMGWSDKAMVLYYSHATPQSRERAAKVRESMGRQKPSAQGNEAISPEMIEALSHLLVDGRLSAITLAAILRGEEPVPEELLEDILTSR